MNVLADRLQSRYIDNHLYIKLFFAGAACTGIVSHYFINSSISLVLSTLPIDTIFSSTIIAGILIIP